MWHAGARANIFQPRCSQIPGLLRYVVNISLLTIFICNFQERGSQTEKRDYFFFLQFCSKVFFFPLFLPYLSHRHCLLVLGSALQKHLMEDVFLLDYSGQVLAEGQKERGRGLRRVKSEAPTQSLGVNCGGWLFPMRSCTNEGNSLVYDTRPFSPRRARSPI